MWRRGEKRKEEKKGEKEIDRFINDATGKKGKERKGKERKYIDLILMRANDKLVRRDGDRCLYGGLEERRKFKTSSI